MFFSKDVVSKYHSHESYVFVALRLTIKRLPLFYFEGESIGEHLQCTIYIRMENYQGTPSGFRQGIVSSVSLLLAWRTTFFQSQPYVAPLLSY